MQQKITRKQFLLSIISAAAVVVVGNAPNMIKKIATGRKSGNVYGNYSYGGSKKNV